MCLAITTRFTNSSNDTNDSNVLFTFTHKQKLTHEFTQTQAHTRITPAKPTNNQTKHINAIVNIDI